MNSGGEFSYTENTNEVFEIMRPTEVKHSEKAETYHEQKEISLSA